MLVLWFSRLLTRHHDSLSRRTVQGELEKVGRELFKQQIRVHAAGRTGSQLSKLLSGLILYILLPIL